MLDCKGEGRRAEKKDEGKGRAAFAVTGATGEAFEYTVARAVATEYTGAIATVTRVSTLP